MVPLAIAHRGGHPLAIIPSGCQKIEPGSGVLHDHITGARTTVDYHRTFVASASVPADLIQNVIAPWVVLKSAFQGITI